MNIYDNESPFRPIEKSDFTFLDAVDFLPKKISARNFLVTPSDNTVNTESEWTISVQPDLPMEKGCFLRLWFPHDIEV